MTGCDWLTRRKQQITITSRVPDLTDMRLTAVTFRRRSHLSSMHGFLNDEAFVSLALRDKEMGTVRMPARELLYGMTVC